MKKKRLIFSIIIVSLLLGISLAMLISSIKNRYDYENKSRMFESINDLDFLDEFVIEDIDDIAKNFTEGKSVQIKFDGEKINVYAYKFADNKSCRNFAEEISGNNYSDLADKNNFHRHYYKHVSFLNIFQKEKLLVFSNEKAYVITAKISERKFNKFIEYFMAKLPLEL